MEAENSRRGACDRCRGQKLRCVGSANPIFNPNSRFQRNEIPCERCKRAGVECYSVRLAPRRAAASMRCYDKRAVGTQTGLGRSPPPAQHHRSPASSRSPNHSVIGSLSTNSPIDQQIDRLAQDVDAPPTIPTTPNEWMAYSHEEEVDWNEMDLETPAWMLDTDLGLPQDPAMVTFNMVTKATSVDWSPNQLDIDASSHQTPSSHRSSSMAKLSSCDDRTHRFDQKQRPSRGPSPNLDSPKSCLQELAKLNEILLREKSVSEGLESGHRSIGQTLHHCQDFLSILRRLRWPSPSSDADESHTGSEWSYSGDAAEPRSHSRSPSVLSSTASSVTSQTPPGSSLEIPALLSIVSCYAYILQSFDNLFTPILDEITRSTPTVPATLTGLRLDGFELDNHNTLQLECWTSVSLNMLDKIENILIGSSRHGGLFSQAKGGLLQDKLFAGLIDALYDENEQSDASPGNGKRQVRAKRLIREIQEALRVIDW